MVQEFEVQKMIFGDIEMSDEANKENKRSSVLLDKYFEIQKQIHDHFGYVEDWAVIPIVDGREASNRASVISGHQLLRKTYE